MALDTIPVDILVDILSPDQALGRPGDTSVGNDLDSWKSVCSQSAVFLNPSFLRSSSYLSILGHWTEIIDEGAVIDAGQTTHPYISNKPNSQLSITKENRIFRGVDHARYTFRYAVRYGFDEVVKKLLDSGIGVDQDLEPASGIKPLTEAASHGHLSTTRLLLRRGANIWLKDGQNHGHNILGLREAVEGGYEEVARLLINHAEQSIQDSDSRLSEIKYPADLLELAAGSENSSASLVHYFLDIYTKIGRGVDLSRLLDSALAGGNEEVVGVVLDCEPSLLWERNGSHLPILHRAVSPDNELLITLLIRRGALVNEADPNGKTALVIAVESDLPAIVETLLDAGADSSVKGPDSQDIISIAAQRGYSETVEVLLEKGGVAIIGDITSLKESVMQASRNGHSDTVATFMGSAIGLQLHDFAL